jgi:hypothetical protein
MPLNAATIYAENIAYEQAQYDPFEDCSTIDDVLAVYYQMVLCEHQDGVACDPTDPNYFLDAVQEARDLREAWIASNKNENIFLAASKFLPGNCLELAEIIVSGNYCDLRF